MAIPAIVRLFGAKGIFGVTWVNEESDGILCATLGAIQLALFAFDVYGVVFHHRLLLLSISPCDVTSVSEDAVAYVDK